jgi:hypothetical protein
VKVDDVRHEAVRALVEMWSAVSAMEIELTAARTNPHKIIKAIDVCIKELKKTRKTFEELMVTRAGSTPAAPGKVQP